jgi:hypothetical protein
VSTRARFRLAYLALACILAVTYVAFFVVPWPHVAVGKSQHPAIDPADYGHVQAYDGYAIVTLAPTGDQLSKYELGLGREAWRISGIYVSDDGKHFRPLTNSAPMGACGAHAWGYALNVIVAVGKCVPGWASVTGGSGHAAEWLRIQNTAPFARRVVVKYDPMGG